MLDLALFVLALIAAVLPALARAPRHFAVFLLIFIGLEMGFVAAVQFDMSRPDYNDSPGDFIVPFLLLAPVALFLLCLALRLLYSILMKIIVRVRSGRHTP